MGVGALGVTTYKEKTCVVCLFPYPGVPQEGANLSVYTYGRDYHKVVVHALSAMGDRFFPNDYTVFSDIGPPVDRPLAFRAGLGFFGENGLLIHPTLGTFFFIGRLETSYALPEDEPLSLTCLHCHKCRTACPAGALSENGFDEKLCASAISQKKGVLSPKEEAIIRKSGLCFGCDICQLVCPLNAHIETSYAPAFTENLITTLTKNMLEPLSGREFKRKYADRAFAWRGKEVLLRNLDVLEKEKE